MERQEVTALKNGSYEAFEKLYKTYSGKLYNFIMRLSSGNDYMAEEIVQTTFIRIWEMRAQINPDASFISFLCTIAKNLLMNMYQHETVQYVYNEYVMKTRPEAVKQTEEATDVQFLNDYIDRLAEVLPAQRKKIFLLSKRKNLSNKEIARMMNISESTVATQLSLALNFVREQLTKHYDKLVVLLLTVFVNDM